MDIPPEQEYTDTIRQVVKHLPHLGVVASESCRNRETKAVVCYDYKSGSTKPQLIPITSYSALRLPTPGASWRLVILEDLDPFKIGLVGAAFKVGPSLFATHLQGSGYHHSEEEPIHSWSKFQGIKGQFSMNWLRPVLPSVPLSTRVRSAIVEDGRPAPRLPCIFPNCDEKIHKVKTNRNIFRQPVNLCAELGGDMAEPFPTGWEERISIWKGVRENCDISESRRISCTPFILT
jgi:hypothetical protein